MRKKTNETNFHEIRGTRAPLWSEISSGRNSIQRYSSSRALHHSIEGKKIPLKYGGRRFCSNDGEINKFEQSRAFFSAEEIFWGEIFFNLLGPSKWRKYWIFAGKMCCFSWEINSALTCLYRLSYLLCSTSDDAIAHLQVSRKKTCK